MGAVSTQHSRSQARNLAQALGWFSIALGAIELMRPRQLRRSVGANVPRNLVRGYGLREIASGAAILAAKNPNQMVWTRVAGDIVDLATLMPTMRRTNPHRMAARAAIGFVGLVTLVDIYAAMQDGSRNRAPARDYSDRSGFPRGAEMARAA